MIPQILQLVEERHAITFLGNQIYDFHWIVSNLGRKKPPIDLHLRNQ